MAKKEHCLFCIQGKMRRNKFLVTNDNKVTKILARVHTDITGLIVLESIGHKRYIIIFIDEASRYITTVAISRKCNILKECKKFKTRVEILRKKIKELQDSQDGGERKGCGVASGAMKV